MLRAVILATMLVARPAGACTPADGRRLLRADVGPPEALPRPSAAVDPSRLLRVDLARARASAAATASPESFAAARHRARRRLHARHGHERRLSRPRRTGQPDADEALPFHSEINVYGSFGELGYFYGFLRVGTPPQRFTVILDTGSTITAIPCSGCRACGAHQNPPFDVALSSTGRYVGCGECGHSCSSGRCRFSQYYLEGSGLEGSYVEDRVCLGDDCPAAHGVDFRFGCATRMTKLFATQLADGIMGVDRQGSTFVNALQAKHALERDQFSLCFSLEGGFMQVGGYSDAHWIVPGSEPAWTPVLQTSSNWFVTAEAFAVGGALLDAVSNTAGGHRALIDTGTTYTYVPADVFGAMRSGFRAWCAADADRCPGRETPGDRDALLCFRGVPGVGALSDSEQPAPGIPSMRAFPNVTVAFASPPGLADNEASAQLCAPPEQYFYAFSGALCVGVFRDGSMTVGSNFMMGHDVIFDREAHRIGVARARCGNARGLPSCDDCIRADEYVPWLEAQARAYGAYAAIAVALWCAFKRVRRFRADPRFGPAGAARGSRRGGSAGGAAGRYGKVGSDVGIEMAEQGAAPAAEVAAAEIDTLAAAEIGTLAAADAEERETKTGDAFAIGELSDASDQGREEAGERATSFDGSHAEAAAAEGGACGDRGAGRGIARVGGGAPPHAGDRPPPARSPAPPPAGGGAGASLPAPADGWPPAQDAADDGGTDPSPGGYPGDIVSEAAAVRAARRAGGRGGVRPEGSVRDSKVAAAGRPRGERLLKIAERRRVQAVFARCEEKGLPPPSEDAVLRALRDARNHTGNAVQALILAAEFVHDPDEED
jgi:hypothetical protein